VVQLKLTPSTLRKTKTLFFVNGKAIATENSFVSQRKGCGKEFRPGPRVWGFWPRKGAKVALKVEGGKKKTFRNPKSERVARVRGGKSAKGSKTLERERTCGKLLCNVEGQKTASWGELTLPRRDREKKAVVRKKEYRKSDLTARQRSTEEEGQGRPGAERENH